MLVGYMRVSTDGDRQTFDLQRDALLTAGVDERHLFEDRVSGSRGERAGLAKALAFIKSGDCLVVWKLDRLGRSLPHLLTTVSDLRARGIGFRSLTEQMDTATPQGEFLFHVFGGFPCCARFPCVRAAASTPVQRLGVVFAHLTQPCWRNLNGRSSRNGFRLGWPLRVVAGGAAVVPRQSTPRSWPP